MSNDSLKEKIYSLIDKTNPEMLQSVYQLLNESDYTDTFKNELNEELANYKKEGKIITQQEMDKLIEAELKTNK